MKPISTLFVMLLGSLAARADIEFTGVLTSAEKSSFALVDTTTTETRWLTLGKSFSGWKITAYDSTKETLTLTMGSTTKTLKLKGSTIQEAKPASPPSITGDATFKIGSHTLSQALALAYDATTELSLGDGITVKITPRLLQKSDSINYEMRIERSSKTNGQPAELLSSPSVLARPGQAFNVEFGDTSISFEPKPNSCS